LHLILGYIKGDHISLARPKEQFRNTTIENLNQLIDDEEYRSRSKDGQEGVFTRTRKLPFNNLLVFLTRGIKSSLQRELDSFYKEVSGGDFNIREVTKGAFTKARAKLNPSAFIELNENALNTFYDDAPYLVWHGMRLLACDGTRLALPHHESIIEEFGQHGFGPNADSKRSLAMSSFLYDTLNLVTLDAQLAPYASSERQLLSKHLDKIQSGDLLLLDRGYPSLALFFELKARGVEFCIRMKEDWWLDVKSFSESEDVERIVTFKLPLKDQSLRNTYSNLSDQLTCRLVSIKLPNGEKEILCTSLIDTEKYTYEDVAELYPHRWSVEEGYKLFKARAEVEYFSGKTARAIKQDFHAKVFMMTLSAILAFPIEERVKKEHLYQKEQQPKKINRTSALSLTGSLMIGLFVKKKTEQAIEVFDKIVAKTTEIIRPNRKFERKKKSKPQPLYNQNYKRL
jgi:hypothetical protein